MVIRFIADADLPAVAEALARDYHLLAPVREGAAVLYRAHEPGMHPFLGRMPNASGKEALLPQTEMLFSYTSRKDHKDLTRTEVFLSEAPPPEPTVILGPRPCDARAMSLQDRIFDGRLVKDPYYIERRKRTVFVTVACERMENTCFCHWTGGGPCDETGSDVMLHRLEGGQAARALTAAGEKLLASLPPALAQEASQAVLDELAAHLASPPTPAPAPDLTGIEDRFLAAFGDMAFWEDQSARCLSCGVCTYLCPTCSCFNITDENSGLSGRRLRTWDTCMSYLYTLEGSGHNPRGSRAHRLRNRVGHKYCYHPRGHGGEFSCTGCGRCIKFCPVSVDIRRIVLDLMEREQPAPAAGDAEEAKP